jgi:ribosome-binding protein aMBF1 (putative translation factor)
MADTPNLPNQSAEDTVFENLGLTRADLGMDTEGSGNEDLDTGSGNEQGGVDSGDGREGQQRQPQGEQQQPPRMSQTPPESRLPASAEVHADHKGNLVNEYGQIVARAGKEARLYQDLHKTRGQLQSQVQTYERQVADVNSRLQKAVEIGRGFHQELTSMKAHQKSIEQFGLDQGEHLTALRLFKELRDNPQSAIKNILTRAATNGINVTELGLAPGGIDSKSLLDMIRQEIGTAVNPLRERTEAENRQRAQTERERVRAAEINSEVAGFFDSNPDARQYLPVFTQTIQKFPGMTLVECWARIQLQLATNPPQRSPNSRGPNGRQRSLPNGRPAPMSGNEDDIAPVTESYDDIIRKAMRAGGLAS